MRRDIQAVPLTMEGRRLITFIDPMQLASTGFALDARVVPLLAMMDGRHDLRDIQAGLMQLTGGSIVPLADIQALIEQLDGACLLESDSFRMKKTAIMEEFARKSSREPVLAGRSYPADAEELKAYISSIEAGLPALTDSADSEIVGILAPHIEIAAAQDAYVDAYRRIRNRCYDLVIILGINHHGSSGMYTLTGKDYLTPFGPLRTDRELVSELKENLPEGCLSEYDFDHMMEHSIEFQTFFLAHYLGASTRVLPVLCKGIHEHLADGKDLFSDERFTAFRDALSEIIARSGRKTLFVSGVDFSHVGPKFGHTLPASMLLKRARTNDAVIIDHLRNGRPREIFANARETHDEFNVCGLASMMLFSSLIEGCTADLLHHGTYDEPATDSAVTFATMVFTRA